MFEFRSGGRRVSPALRDIDDPVRRGILTPPKKKTWTPSGKREQWEREQEAKRKGSSPGSGFQASAIRAARTRPRATPPDRTCHYGDGDIASMVKRRVPAHASGKLLARVQAQGQGRDRRTENVADNCNHAVGNRDRPEARPCENDGSTDAQHGKRQDDRSALGRVSSIAAPIGVWTASPSRPPIVVTNPTSDWLQCCWVTRNTLR
jgi:hypothetical protein